MRSRLVLRLLLAALIFLCPHPARAQLTQNEPAGSTKLAECDFDNTKDCGVLLNFYPGGGALTNMPDAPYSPSGVFYNYWSPGAPTGNSAGVAFIGPRNRELYVSLFWKIDPDFEGYSGGNKLFFMRDTANPDTTPGCNTNGIFGFAGTDGIDARNLPFHMMWNINTAGLDNSNNPTCNDGWSKGVLCPSNVNDVPLYKDTWYHIEAYVMASSCPTCRDGIIRWWIDGQLAGNVENYNYGCGTMNEFVFDQAWDNSAQCRDANGNPPRGRDCTRFWAHYLDHLYISAPNCPNGCPVTGNTGGGISMEESQRCEPIPDVEVYVEKDKPAPVGQAIRDALGRN